MTPVYPYPEPGVYVGIERNVSELAMALSELGVDLEILTTFWNGGADNDTHRGIRIHRIPDTSYWLGRIGRVLDAHYLSFSLCLRTRPALFERCDITHSFMPLAGTGWVRKRTPLVTTFQHGETASGLRDLLYIPVHHQIERHSYSSSDRVVVPSTVSKDEVINKVHLDPDSVIVIPHGVNRNVFNPSFDEGSDTLQVLFVGPLEARKNVPMLVRAVSRAAKEIPSVELHIVGAGPARDEIERTAIECGIADITTFHGYCSDDELVPLYQSADVFGFPSLKEGFGMVMIEAMACGVPVIAPDDSPFDEVLGDAGILTDRTPDAFAHALITLAEDQDRLNELSKNARDRANNEFSWEKTARRHVELYQNLS